MSYEITIDLIALAYFCIKYFLSFLQLPDK